MSSPEGCARVRRRVPDPSVWTHRGPLLKTFSAQDEAGRTLADQTHFVCGKRWRNYPQALMCSHPGCLNLQSPRGLPIGATPHGGCQLRSDRPISSGSGCLIPMLFVIIECTCPPPTVRLYRGLAPLGRFPPEEAFHASFYVRARAQ